MSPLTSGGVPTPLVQDKLKLITSKLANLLLNLIAIVVDHAVVGVHMLSPGCF